MKKLGNRGELNILLIPLILVVLILFGTGWFAYWSYTNMQNYKYHTDTIAAAAVKAANQQLTTQLNNQFAEREKKPYKTYNGPAAEGSIQLTYPKTWSAYVSVDDSSGTPLDGYFYPDVIPNTGQSSNGTPTANFALRIQVLQQTYATTLGNFQAEVQSGQVVVNPYTLPKLPDLVGAEITGQVQEAKTGTLIILPVRGETLQIWTEGSDFQSDFESIILQNFTFSP